MGFKDIQGQGLNEQDWNLKVILSSDSQLLLYIRITQRPFRNSKVQASPSIVSIEFSVSVTQCILNLPSGSMYSQG